MIGEIRQNFTEASASVGLILATALVVKIKLCITFFKGIDILTFKDHMVKLLFRGKVSQSSRKHTFHKHSRTPTMDQNFNEVIYNISFPSNMEDIFTN